MDLSLTNVSDTYRYVLNQSGANPITLGNNDPVNWNAAGVVALAGNQTIDGLKSFQQAVSAPSVYITNTVSDASLKIAGNSNVYIDLKKPYNHDYSARISTDGSAGAFTTLTGPLVLQTNGNNNRLLITQAGNVGIGIDNPDSKLHLAVGGTGPLEGLLVRNYAPTPGSNAVIAAHVNGHNGGDPYISWDINGVIGWCAGIDNSDSDKFKIANHYVDLASNTKVTIDGNRVGIGTSNPISLLHLRGDGNSWQDGILFEQAGANGRKYAISSKDNGRFSISDETSSADRFIISSGGLVGIGRVPTTNRLEVEGNASKTTATAWLANSDKRIKKDINTITGALEKICKVNLVKFKYTDEYKKDHSSIEDVEYLNVIAQEFAEVFPDHVKENGDKMPDGSSILQVDIHPLTIYSAAAIQELKQIIDCQNIRISELESKLL